MQYDKKCKILMCNPFKIYPSTSMKRCKWCRWWCVSSVVIMKDVDGWGGSKLSCLLVSFSGRQVVVWYQETGWSVQTVFLSWMTRLGIHRMMILMSSCSGWI